MQTMTNIINIFNNNCSITEINKYSDVKLRNTKITTSSAVLYRFLYSDKYSTKQSITSKFNNSTNSNNIFFSRQALDDKESRIPLGLYDKIYVDLKHYTDSIIKSDDNNESDIIVGIDGVCYMNDTYDILTSIGIYDITNKVPIALSEPNEKRNNEIRDITKYINEHSTDFHKNFILVFDRGYFSYEFMDFLISKNLRFVIRAKKDAHYLDSNNDIKLPKSYKNYDLINKLRTKVRIVKNKNNTFSKKVLLSTKKEDHKTATINIETDYVLVTNIKSTKYTDTKLLNIYNSRWDIEVFFKYIKNNFKLQNMPEKYPVNYVKMCYCELIITLIERLIEYDWINNNKNKFDKKAKNDTKYIRKINKSNLVKGIFIDLLERIIKNNLSLTDYIRFCKSYIVLTANTSGRSFVRTSKTPFTKWYAKGYSDIAKFKKILKAIDRKTTHKLDKNLKILAKQIISIEEDG